MTKKQVLLTGGAGGIGKAITNLLVENDCHVFACDLDKDIFTLSGHPSVSPVYLDISDRTSIREAYLQVRQLTSGLDAIINNAGLFDRFPLVETEPERFEKLIYTNVSGHQFVTQQFFTLLYKRKGRVINISSESALVPLPLLTYGMSKRMFDVWSCQLRQELLLLNMHVSLIRPGGHKTPFLDKTIDVMSEINPHSLFSGVQVEMKLRGQKILDKTRNDPVDIARVVLRALKAKHPRKEYWVNVSGLYKFLNALPKGIRDRLITGNLKKLME